MQRELLRDEEAIEVERLVRKRQQHDAGGTEDDGDERDEVGTRARESARGGDVYAVFIHRKAERSCDEPMPRDVRRETRRRGNLATMAARALVAVAAHATPRESPGDVAAAVVA